MTRSLVPFGLLGFTGLTLVLSELRWFRRVGLTARLAPYAPFTGQGARLGLLSVASFREVVTPVAQLAGDHLARLFGVTEDLERRLRRIHSPLEVSSFRVRQAGWAGGAFLASGLAATAADLAAPVAMLIVFGSPTLAFLVLEQQVARASEAWQRRVFLELPVVAEQLGMLTSAGWSLSAAIGRIAERGNGNCAADLRRVVRRMHQGLGEVEALREWGQLAEVDALDRLISVLALNREAGDLGRLIADEARAIRREAHRQLIEVIERRNQQVWVPVTVAALVPGVMLMGVPFVDALSLFSAA